MDSIAAIWDGIYASLGQIVPILYALAAGAILDLLTGLLAAWRSGTLNGNFIQEWIGSHVDKIGKIVLVLTAGVLVGGTDSPAGLAIIALGGTAAAAYLASVVTSITDNIGDARAKTKGAPSSVGMIEVVHEQID